MTTRAPGQIARHAIVPAVLAVALAACGGDDAAQGPATSIDPTVAFCDAWSDLGPVPGVNDAEAATGWADGVEQLLAVAPPRHRPAVEQMSRTATAFVGFGDRAGWSAEGFSALSTREQESMAGQADDLALFFTGPVAVYAHETCPDADDPALTLACPGLLAFVTGDGRLPGGVLVEPVTGAAPVADPAAAADPATEPGTVEVRSGERDGVVVVSYVGDDGRALRLVEHEQTPEGWVAVRTSRCG